MKISAECAGQLIPYFEAVFLPSPKWLRGLVGDEFFQEIVTVHVTSTQVTDLTPLENLTELESLLLSDTQVTDLTPLATLTNLNWVYINKTPVTDLTPLTSLTNLAWLGLHDTQVTDLTPLENLTNLKSLWLDVSFPDHQVEQLQKAMPKFYFNRFTSH